MAGPSQAAPFCSEGLPLAGTRNFIEVFTGNVGGALRSATLQSWLAQDVRFSSRSRFVYSPAASVDGQSVLDFVQSSALYLNMDLGTVSPTYITSEAVAQL